MLLTFKWKWLRWRYAMKNNPNNSSETMEYVFVARTILTCIRFKWKSHFKFILIRMNFLVFDYISTFWWICTKSIRAAYFWLQISCSKSKRQYKYLRMLTFLVSFGQNHRWSVREGAPYELYTLVNCWISSRKVKNVFIQCRT